MSSIHRYDELKSATREVEELHNEVEADYPDDPASIAKRMQQVQELDAKIRESRKRHDELTMQRRELAKQLLRDAQHITRIAQNEG